MNSLVKTSKKVACVFICLSILIATLDIDPIVRASAGGLTEEVIISFEETTHNNNRTKPVNITNLHRVDAINVSGSVGAQPSYYASGDTVTVTVGGGAPTSTVMNPDHFNRTHTVTQSNNQFDNFIEVTEGDYSGSLYKQGESVVISGTDSHSREETDTRSSSTNSFANSITYNSGGYAGTLNKDGNSYVTSGSAGSSRTETDSRQSSTNSFPSGITYSSGGYSGTLYSYGTSYVVSGYAYDSRVETASRTSSTNSFASGISYNSGGYSGTLYTYGSSYVISGTAGSSRTQTDTRYSNSSNFASSIFYNSGGYSGNLYRSGSAIVVSGSAGGSRTETDYIIKDVNSFVSSISYSSGGYTGTLTKNGSSYVTSGMPGGSRTQTDSRQSSTNSFPSTISYYGQDGYSGTLSKSGSATVISGSAAHSKSVGSSRTNTINSFPSTISYSSDGYSGTLSKSGSATVVSGSAGGSRTETTILTNIYNSFPATTSYNSGGYSGTLYKSGGVYMEHGIYKQKYSGTVTKPDTRTWLQLYSGVVSKPDTRVWRQNYSGTVTKPDTRKWRQNYSGTVTKPDTRYWQQNYSGTVTKPDSRVWQQNYSGTVVRPESRIWQQNYSGVVSTPDTRVWGQKYKGTVSKPDTRVWSQNYSGKLYKYGQSTINYWKYTVILNVTLKDMTPPQTPPNFKFSNVTTSSLLLSWAPSYDNSGYVQYDVYMNGLYSLSTTNTFKLVDGLDSGTYYSFYVIAKDDSGNESLPTPILGVTTFGFPGGEDGGNITIIPLQPTHTNGELITSSNKNSCQICYEYFEEYIWLKTPNYQSEVFLTAYDAWAKDTYGLNGLETFWLSLESIIFYDPSKSLIDNLQDTLDLAGMIPVIGEGLDLANGVIYYIRGDNVNAIISFASMIPVIGAGGVVLKLSNKFTNAITALKGTKIILKTAEEANAELFLKGYHSPPYKPGSNVYEFTTTESTKLVRVHGDGNQARVFVMEAKEIMDTSGNYLTPNQIKNKFAIPEAPTKVSEVTVPAGTKMRTGIANSQEFGGEFLQGGATQYDIIMDKFLPEEWFSVIHEFIN